MIAAAEKIERMWEANPTFSLGDITRAAFSAKLAALRELRSQTEEARRQLTNLSNRTDDSANELNSLNSRALSGVRAVFGPDSTQYQEAGGTRTSERRKSTKKGGGGSTGTPA